MVRFPGLKEPWGSTQGASVTSIQLQRAHPEVVVSPTQQRDFKHERSHSSVQYGRINPGALQRMMQKSNTRRLRVKLTQRQLQNARTELTVETAPSPISGRMFSNHPLRVAQECLGPAGRPRAYRSIPGQAFTTISGLPSGFPPGLSLLPPPSPSQEDQDR